MSAIATRRRSCEAARRRRDRDGGLWRNADPQRGRAFLSSGGPCAGIGANPRCLIAARSGSHPATTSSRTMASRPLSSRFAAMPSSPSSTFGLPIYRWRPQAEISLQSTPGGVRISPPAARACSMPTRWARRSGCLPMSTRLSARSCVMARSSRSTRSIARPASPCRRPRLALSSAQAPISHARLLLLRPRPPRARGSSASATIPTRSRAAGCRCGETAAGAGSTAGLRFPITPTGRAFRRLEATGAERILVTHGSTEPLTRYLREKGLDARDTQTAYGDDEDAARTAAARPEGEA